MTLAMGDDDLHHITEELSMNSQAIDCLGLTSIKCTTPPLPPQYTVVHLCVTPFVLIFSPCEHHTSSLSVRRNIKVLRFVVDKVQLMGAHPGPKNAAGLGFSSEILLRSTEIQPR